MLYLEFFILQKKNKFFLIKLKIWRRKKSDIRQRTVVFLHLLIFEIILWLEVSNPPRLRIQGDSTRAPHRQCRRTEIVVSYIILDYIGAHDWQTYKRHECCLHVDWSYLEEGSWEDVYYGPLASVQWSLMKLIYGWGQRWGQHKSEECRPQHLREQTSRFVFFFSIHRFIQCPIRR